MLQFAIVDEEIFDEQYEVTINGKIVHSIKARVSAMPYNTMWPGYQRPLNQTELTSIISFASDEEVFVCVKPNTVVLDETTDIRIRPLSKKISYEVVNGKICFALKETGAYTVELNGFHEVLTIIFDPIRNWLEQAKKERQNNGKILYYAQGIHEIGTIELESHTTVVIDSGAVLYGSFTAICAEDIKICGYGIIDGGKEERTEDTGGVLYDYEAFIPSGRDEIRNCCNEQAMLSGCMRFYRCSNISLEGVMLRDSAFWSFCAMGCDNLLIDNVKSIGMWKYNTDGIDVCNSSNVVIRNCFLRNFDDCIVVKGICGWEDRNNENILVENCVIWCDWGRSLELGAETNAPEYRNIIMRNCDLIHGSTVLMDIQHHNNAEIHHCSFENINAEYSKYQLPDTYQADMEEDFQEEANTKHPVLMGIYMMNTNCFSMRKLHGCVHDITFRNITVYKDDEVTKPESCFYGFDGHRVSNVVIENLCLNGEKVVTLEEGNIFINEYTDRIRLV